MTEQRERAGEKFQEQLAGAKQRWICRYKSKEGRAIARRAWENCAAQYGAIIDHMDAESDHLVAEAVKKARAEALLEARAFIHAAYNCAHGTLRALDLPGVSKESLDKSDRCDYAILAARSLLQALRGIKQTQQSAHKENA